MFSPHHPATQFYWPAATAAAGQVGQGVLAGAVAAGVVAPLEAVGETAATGAATVPASATVLVVEGVVAAPVLSVDVPAVDATAAGASCFFIPLTWVWASPLIWPVTGSILIVVLVWIVMRVSAAKTVLAANTRIRPINAIVFISSTPRDIWREGIPTRAI
jgi:hypothetical protein